MTTDILSKLTNTLQEEIASWESTTTDHPDDTFDRGKIDGMKKALDMIRDAAVDAPMQWGYAHAEAHNAIGWPDLNRPAWYHTKDEAQKAMENDLRWNLPTFLVRRLAPGQMERAGEDFYPRTHFHDSIRA